MTTAAGSVPHQHGERLPHTPPTLPRTAIVAAIVALAFAAPSIVSVLQGRGIANETRLSRAMLSCFGGITLPILGAAVAGNLLGVNSRARRRLDRLVAAGLDPRRALLGPFLSTIVVTSLAAALVGAVVVTALRSTLHLGTTKLVSLDALGTAWTLGVGAATWTAPALVLVAKTGRPGRGYFVVLIDLGTRLLPGALAWVAPSAHVSNLLGAAPPRSFVHIPVLDQRVSSIVLLLLLALFSFLATRRYQGAPGS